MFSELVAVFKIKLVLPRFLGRHRKVEALLFSFSKNAGAEFFVNQQPSNLFRHLRIKRRFEAIKNYSLSFLNLLLLLNCWGSSFNSKEFFNKRCSMIKC